MGPSINLLNSESLEGGVVGCGQGVEKLDLVTTTKKQNKKCWVVLGMVFFAPKGQEEPFSRAPDARLASAG